MTDDWDEMTGLLAAGASCPMPDCGAITVAYRERNMSRQGTSELWEFKCPRCGAEFVVPEEDLLFQSVREEWLRAGIHAA